MNCDDWPFPAGSQIPTSPVWEDSRAETDAVASMNMPSGFKSPTKRDE